MKEHITIVNQTMELKDCKNQWFYDEKYECWCLEDILYTANATTPKFQRMSIFVPEPYMRANGEIVDDGTMNGYQATSVPIIFENNSAGYMQMPHTWLGGPRCYAEQYLKKGFVYVTCGNRGHDSKDRDGNLCGKSPINLIDLKTGIRFLRHNHENIPGDMGKIISVGWSAGGAMSTLLAVTGDNERYQDLLEENGAFMDESDAVYASQIYCPIIDLEHADLAYEWMFKADKENEESPAGPAGVMNQFQEALSQKLSEKYIQYFNELHMQNPENGEVLILGEDGRSGSGYDYLMKKLEKSAGKFLGKLQAHESPLSFSVDDYMSGNYTYKVLAPEPEKKDAALMSGHAGPGVALQTIEDEEKEPPTLGDMVSRPPKGIDVKPFEPPMMEVQGKDKNSWLTWDGNNAKITSLDDFVLLHRRRMKPCTSFDVLPGNSGENKVFGDAKRPALHFNTEIADLIYELKEQFPTEFEKYYENYLLAKNDHALELRKYLINPLNFIGTNEVSRMADYYRICVGSSDADTSLSISMTLACKLSELGKNVEYEIIWDQPHSEADYAGEVTEWIEKITK